MVNTLKKKSNLDFDKTVKAIEVAMLEEGFSNMLTKSMDSVFKTKLGVDYPRYTIILGCNATYAKAAMDVSKDMGLLYPCSFTVWEEGDEVWIGHISIMKIGSEIGIADAEGMEPVIEMTGAGVRKIWEKL